MSAPDDKKLIERLRAEADLDARAGEPLGKRMREAAARLEALTRPATDRGELVEALTYAVQQLDAVEKWAREKCPCEDEQPNPCPLCGARVEDPNGACKAGTALPYLLAGRVRQATTSGRATLAKEGK